MTPHWLRTSTIYPNTRMTSCDARVETGGPESPLREWPPVWLRAPCGRALPPTPLFVHNYEGVCVPLPWDPLSPCRQPMLPVLSSVSPAGRRPPCGAPPLLPLFCFCCLIVCLCRDGRHSEQRERRGGRQACQHRGGLHHAVQVEGVRRPLLPSACAAHTTLC